MRQGRRGGRRVRCELGLLKVWRCIHRIGAQSSQSGLLDVVALMTLLMLELSP